MLEAVALAVHLQDMDVVGEAVQQRPGEAFRAEDFRPLVDDQQVEPGQLPLEVEPPSFVSGLHQLVHQGSGGGEAHRHSSLAGGQSQGDVGLAGAAVADGDDVLTAFDVFAPRQLNHQGLVHRGDVWEVGGVQALDCGESRRPGPPLHHALVSVDELELGRSVMRPSWTAGSCSPVQTWC